MPPIRDDRHKKALIKGLNDGIIDFVTSDHSPIDIDNKKTDFENSLFGSTGLESIFGALNSIFKVDKSIDILTRGKNIFGVKDTNVDVGQNACLSLFDPEYKYTFIKKNIISKSKNSCFINSKLNGKAYGIISNNLVKVLGN